MYVEQVGPEQRALSVKLCRRLLDLVGFIDGCLLLQSGREKSASLYHCNIAAILETLIPLSLSEQEMRYIVVKRRQEHRSRCCQSRSTSRLSLCWRRKARWMYMVYMVLDKLSCSWKLKCRFLRHNHAWHRLSQPTTTSVLSAGIPILASKTIRLWRFMVMWKQV